MNTTSQIFKLIDHMTYIGPITAKEAMDNYAISRCASRIHDIKCLGYTVIRRMIPVQNRFGETTHVAQYSLKKETKTNERTQL